MPADIIRILCVDDHAFIIDGLAARLEPERDLELVGRLDSCDDLLPTVRELRPDVVLLDIEMPGADTFEALADLTREFKTLRPIILSAYVRDHYIDEAYRAGARGYLSKSDPPQLLIDSIRQVMRGELAQSPEVASRTTPRSRADGQHEVRSRLDSLTRREMQILRMIARGMSRTDIAEDICRSPMTVDNHRKSIMKKLDINDRGELVRFAIAEGLVEV